MLLGDGRRKSFSGKTRDEVRSKLAEALHARTNGAFADSKGLTVAQYLDQWLAQVVKPSVRHWTYTSYEVNVRRHIKPAIGHIALDRLTPAHVQALINQASESGLSPKSVRYGAGRCARH